MDANDNHANNDDIIDSDIVECFLWIKRCGFLETIDDNYSRDDLPIMLIGELTDGVLLMNLLWVLSGKQIDPSKYHEFTPCPQNSQFDSMTNLKLFNSLIVQNFGVKSSELVDHSDIFTGRNFGKFVALLSKISHSDYAKKSGINGFPERNHQIDPSHQFYIDLEEIAVTSDIYTKRRPLHDTTNIKHNDEENIYETLVQHKAETVTKSRREMCIMEIVESEKNYVESLMVLVQNYKNQLTGTLSTDEIGTIFKYIEEMLRIHQMLHSKLNIAVLPNQMLQQRGGLAGTASGTPATKLHQVFIDSKQDLLIYGRYCIHLQQAQNLVNDMLKTSQIKRLSLEKLQDKSGKFRKFPLSDLLTLPMQRILKYHLLLQTLIKYTDSDHEDYEGLQTSHEEMIAVATFVNEVKRDQEAIISIDKIQEQMNAIHLPNNKKLSDYGRRQKDGELKVQLSGEAKPRQRHVFVFDKMLMLAKRKSDGYDFKEAYYLLDKMPETTEVLTRKQDKGFPFKLCIRKDNHEMEPILMFCKSEETRRQWIEAFTTAITNHYPPGAKMNQFNFEMTTFAFDTVPPQCYFCKKLLGGIFFQGYLCKNTGVKAHKTCIPDSPSHSVFNPVALPPRKPSADSIGTTVSSGSGARASGFLQHHHSSSHILTNTTNFTSHHSSSTSISSATSIHHPQHQQFFRELYSPPPPSRSTPTNFFPQASNHQPGTCRDAFGMSPFSSSINPVATAITTPTPSASITPSASYYNNSILQPSSSAFDYIDNSSSNSGGGGCGNSTASNYPAWYVGEMEREEATRLLQQHNPGTFLIRVSTNQRRAGQYSLSVMDNEPKHMRIKTSNSTTLDPVTAPLDSQYQISAIKYSIENAHWFPRLQDLVDFYSSCNLNQYFQLDVANLKLSNPIKQSQQHVPTTNHNSSMDFNSPPLPPSQQRSHPFNVYSPRMGQNDSFISAASRPFNSPNM